MKPPPEDGAPTRRLFYAWWPGEACRAALVAATAARIPVRGARPTAAANLHVTAVFLGRVPEHRLPELKALGGRSGLPATAFRFDRLEWWPRPRILVAAAGEVPEAALVLVDSLWRGLDPLGFRREPRPFRPHVTLARQVKRRPEDLSIPAVSYLANRLALVESTAVAGETRYLPLAEWPLA